MERLNWIAAHRCLRKNRKSRWLWRVTTCRPWNSGNGGKSVWNMRPTAWPRRVTKLLSTSSGLWGVDRACPWGVKRGTWMNDLENKMNDHQRKFSLSIRWMSVWSTLLAHLAGEPEWWHLQTLSIVPQNIDNDSKLTWLLCILIHDTNVLVPASGSPSGNLPQVKILAFLSSEKFCTGKYAHELVAKVVGKFLCFRRCRYQNLWWPTWIIGGRKIGCKRVWCYVNRWLVQHGLARGRCIQIYGWRRVGGKNRRIGFASVVKCARNIRC